MLEGLDDIPWTELEHAYGSASDVPDLIRKLGSKEKEIRDSALWHLCGNIFHQGTRYEASPYAIPFIFELLEDSSIEGKADLIQYLLALAMGYEEEYLPSGFSPYEYRAAIYAEVARLKEHAATDYLDTIRLFSIVITEF